MKLHFWGATETVTGSMTFLELKSGNVMIDCGLAQGPTRIEDLNDIALPIKVSSIKDIIITHAHLDHSGYLPRLVKEGFQGKIHCTPPTAKLIRIILTDSAKLNSDGFYEQEDVVQTLSKIVTHEWEEPFEIFDLNCKLVPASHIIGASSIHIKYENKKIIFSGDLGRIDDPILQPLGPAVKADIIIMESTYGGKSREGHLEKELEHFLNTIANGSRVGIIASFAVARAQMLLTLIHQFYINHPDKKVRVVIDSPMMKEANKVYQQYAHLTKYPTEVFEALDEIDTIDYQKEFNSLKKKSGPLIILSSSGMLTGGRIGRHLQNWHEDSSAILYLPGYQGEGTPGRKFVEGNRTLMGQDGVSFNWSGEVWSSDAFSSHADQGELIDWLGTQNKKAKVFLLHGEESSKEALRLKLLSQNFEDIQIPARGSVVNV